MLARRFARLSVQGQGSGARFIFSTDRPLDQIRPEELTTSLRKKVYSHLQSGKMLYDFGGVMLL